MALNQGATAVQQMNKVAGVEKFEDLREKMEENKMDMDERNEFFTDIANEDNDDLLDELDEIEADSIKKTFDVDVEDKVIKKDDADLLDELDNLEE